MLWFIQTVVDVFVLLWTHLQYLPNGWVANTAHVYGGTFGLHVELCVSLDIYAQTAVHWRGVGVYQQSTYQIQFSDQTEMAQLNEVSK